MPALSHTRPPALRLLSAAVMGVLLVGGDTLQVVMGLPMASLQILQGLILFSVLAAETLSRFRIKIVRVSAGTAEEAK